MSLLCAWKRALLLYWQPSPRQPFDHGYTNQRQVEVVIEFLFTAPLAVLQTCMRFGITDQKLYLKMQPIIAEYHGSLQFGIGGIQNGITFLILMPQVNCFNMQISTAFLVPIQISLPNNPLKNYRSIDNSNTFLVSTYFRTRQTLERLRLFQIKYFQLYIQLNHLNQYLQHYA